LHSNSQLPDNVKDPYSTKLWENMMTWTVPVFHNSKLKIHSSKKGIKCIVTYQQMFTVGLMQQRRASSHGVHGVHSSVEDKTYGHTKRHCILIM
jgi:hypothetical protein